MDKVKSTFRVSGQEIRLTDPDHFYDWMREQGITGGSLESAAMRYASEFPSRVEAAEPF